MTYLKMYNSTHFVFNYIDVVDGVEATILVLICCVCMIAIRQIMSQIPEFQMRHGLTWPLFCHCASAVFSLLMALKFKWLKPTQLLHPLEHLTLSYLEHTYLSPLAATVLFFSGPIILRIRIKKMFDEDTARLPVELKVKHLFLEPILEEVIFRLILLQVLINWIPVFISLLIIAAGSSLVTVAQRYDLDYIEGRLTKGDIFYYWAYGATVQYLIGSVYARERSLLSAILIHILFRFLGIPKVDRPMDCFFWMHCSGGNLAIIFLSFYLFLPEYDLDGQYIYPPTTTTTTTPPPPSFLNWIRRS